MFYLVGDIGGTNTRLAIYRGKKERGECIKKQVSSSHDHPDLQSIVKDFLKESRLEIKRACFAVAGPVKKSKSQTTNLPWIVDAGKLSKELSIEKVGLINDLQAHAYGVKLLESEDFAILNEGDPESEGNQAMISAGTGLGEAGIYFDGKNYHPFACEGGHGDFGPRSALEDELLKYLRVKFHHVSYERILSGPGLCHIYQFLVETKKERESPSTFEMIQKGDSARLISERGIEGSSTACFQALQMFVSIYGAEAGNLALKMYALGGVFLGGGIALKLSKIIEKGVFMENFKRKGRFSELLSKIPVKLALNDQTALLGSFYYARSIM